jgi:hypothetical protein
MAGRKETEILKPIDKAIFRMVSKSPGRNASEPTGGLEKQNPKVESPVAGRRQYGSSQLTDAARSFGGVIGMARRQGHAKQLEKPSSSRREIGGAGSRITGDTGKSVEGERDSAGSVVARNRSNVRGAKGPCCLQWL